MYKIYDRKRETSGETPDVYKGGSGIEQKNRRSVLKTSRLKKINPG